MKKYINYILAFLVLYFIFNGNCYASTNTFVRTNDDLRIPSDVVADSNNHDDIMNTPSINSSEKVYDFVDLLSPSEEKELYDKIIEYNKISNYDAVIVTTDDLSGKELSKYAYNFYDYNDFKSEGVIFIIYVGSDRPGIFMGNCAPSGSEIFHIYSDKVINSTLKYLYNNSFTNDNYYEACYNFVKIVNGFYIQSKNGPSHLGKDGEVVQTIPIFDITIIAVALTFITMYVLIKISSNKKKLKYDISDNINMNNFNISCDYDKLVEK